MAEKRKPLRFVRIRGRIVPIFGKKGSNKREGFKGAGSLLGGTTLAIGGAALAGTLRNKALRLKSVADVTAANSAASLSRRAGKRISKQSFIAQAKAFKTLGRASKISRVATFSFSKSRIASSSLVGLGVNKLIQASGIEQNDFVNDLTSEVSGVGAAFATEAFSSRTFRKIALGESLRKGIKKDAIKGFQGFTKFLLRRKGIKI